MTNNNNWMDDVAEEVTELLSDYKVVKFKTHKARKAMIGQILGIFKDGVIKNTAPKENTEFQRFSRAPITRPLGDNHRGEGHAVMTESKSMQGDEISQRGPVYEASEITRLKRQIKELERGK